MEPKIDTVNTWSLCPNYNVICKLREVYLCIIKLKDVTIIKIKKNRGKGKFLMENNLEYQG